MILWWGKKKQPDPKTGETPIEPLKPGETPASPIVSLDQQLFGNAPIVPQPVLDDDDDPIGLKKPPLVSRPNAPLKLQRVKSLFCTSLAKACAARPHGWRKGLRGYPSARSIARRWTNSKSC